MTNATKERFTEPLVLHDNDGDSHWQPVPANGYVTVKLTPDNWDGPFSCGVQVVAPHSYIRKHAHDRNVEAVFCWGGKGKAVVGDTEHPMEAGTLVMLPRNVPHKFVNDSDEDLKLFWTISPGGLEDFFRQIGRPRTPGEPAPANFPRPENVLEIERNTVFAAPIED